ncbi:Gamma-tubulin complex component 3 [Clydaea vesicula]|uniref:Gamma-tubulin complex component 3 n=1 Tax=Clydaea vesicula TaxID=447962 RepID=A0AAD5XZP8_9FUNG|nr:Gamma-tubulin complex component 3 [Clydaea vesicula]
MMGDEVENNKIFLDLEEQNSILVQRLLELHSKTNSENFTKYCIRLLNSRFLPKNINFEDFKISISNINKSLLNLVSKLDKSSVNVLTFLLSLSKVDKSIANTPNFYFLNSLNKQTKINDVLKPLKRNESQNGVQNEVTDCKHNKATISTPFHNQLPSSEIISAMLYSFIGVDSSKIKENNIIGDLSTPVKLVICDLLQMSTTYKILKNFCDSKTENEGIIYQSLKAQISSQLNEYYRLIAVLEQNNKTEELSLRRLLVWTKQPLLRLQILLNYCDLIKTHRGGAFLSKLYRHRLHGNPVVSELSLIVLDNVSKPFFEMIKSWMYHGVVDDSNEEFFISVDLTLGVEEFWKNRDCVRNNMVPCFFSESLVKKSLNFIRYVCSDKTFSIQTLKNDAVFSYGKLLELTVFVEKVYKKTNKRLLELIYGKYKLFENLLALKKYLLLGQGDFIQHLLVDLESNLSKSAKLLFRHNLTGTLESAIRSSNAQYEDPDILSKLDIELSVMKSPVESGWDSFCLKYQLDSPLNTIITKSCMKVYTKLFLFLWKVKRVELSLNKSWCLNMRNRRSSNIEVEKHLHKCKLVCSEMIHFVYQLQYYFQCEVIESSWLELKTLMSRNVNGDYDYDYSMLIKIHSEVYLKSLVEKGLQGNKHRDILKKLKIIFDCILEFKIAHENLYHWCSEQVENGMEIEKFEYMNTLTSKFDSQIKENEHKMDNLNNSQENHSILKLSLISKQFRNEIHGLLNLLAIDQDINLREQRMNHSHQIDSNEDIFSSFPSLSPTPSLSSLITSENLNRKVALDLATDAIQLVNRNTKLSVSNSLKDLVTLENLTINSKEKLSSLNEKATEFIECANELNEIYNETEVFIHDITELEKQVTNLEQVAKEVDNYSKTLEDYFKRNMELKKKY